MGQSCLRWLERLLYQVVPSVASGDLDGDAPLTAPPSRGLAVPTHTGPTAGSKAARRRAGNFRVSRLLRGRSWSPAAGHFRSQHRPDLAPAGMWSSTVDNSLGRESSDHGISRPPNAKAPHELPSSLHRHSSFRRLVRPLCLRRQGLTDAGCSCAHTCTCSRCRTSSRTGTGRRTSRNGHARPAARSHRRGPDGRPGRGDRRRAGLRI
jgi:hypothetical protein